MRLFFKIGICLCIQIIAIGECINAQGLKALFSDVGYVNTATVYNGKVYAADIIENQIIEFDVDGEKLNTLGREGRGPGEFRGLYDIDICNGLLFSVDHRMKKISVYDLNNHSLVREYIPDKIPLRGLKGIQCSGDKIFLEFEHGYNQGRLDIKRDNLVIEYSQDFKKGDTLLTVKAKEYILNKMDGGFSVMPMPFPNRGVFDIGENYIVYANNRADYLYLMELKSGSIDSLKFSWSADLIPNKVMKKELDFFHIRKSDLGDDVELHERFPNVDVIDIKDDVVLVQKGYKSNGNAIYRTHVGGDTFEKVFEIEPELKMIGVENGEIVLADIDFGKFKLSRKKIGN
ncbi:MAG: 6-bladed beta-propeller [Bacteroidota bacterium]